jgi:hypothetical protein
MRAFVGAFVLALLLVPGTSAGGAAGRSTPPSPTQAPSATAPRAGPAPRWFVENRGQTDESVSLYARTRAGTVWLTGDGLTYGFVGGGERWAVKLDFVGGRDGAIAEGRRERRTRVNRLVGTPDRWHADLRTYDEAVWRGVWPGIDVVYETTGGGLKSTFEVAAGADPSAIAFDVRGATACALDDEGRLRVTTPFGGFTDDRPVAWQDTPDGRRPVDAAFALKDSRVRFVVGAYDPTLPLTIDPASYIYAGFLGGAGTEFAGGLDVDAQGNAYVTGRTTSDETSFPVEAGYDMDYDDTGFGGADAFVAKISPAGDDLVYVTYFGGTKFEMATGIRVTADGSVVVCGFTGSKDDFPAAVGPDLTWGGGAYDGFVAKLNATGTALAWAGFVGGLTDAFGWDDVPAALDLDETGRAYLVGTTTATEATFPVVGGHLDATHNGGSDVYVVLVKADGTAFEEAGYLGGAGSDTGTDIAVGPGHSITITAQTTDGGSTFPKLVGPDLAYGGGPKDGVVARFDANGTLLWCGFWGGALDDFARGVDVDDAGNAYLVGVTNSGEASFPVVNATDATWNGQYDACFAEVKADGTAFLVSSYLGGVKSDEGNDVRVSGDGKTLHLFGTTASTEATFPVKEAPGPKTAHTDAPSLTFGGGQDVFVSRCTRGTAGQVYESDATYFLFGDTAREEGEEVFVDEDGTVFFLGQQYADGDASAHPVVGPELVNDGNEELLVGAFDASAAGGGGGSAFYQFFIDAFGPSKGGTATASGRLDVPETAQFGDTLTLGVGGVIEVLQLESTTIDNEMTFVSSTPGSRTRVVIDARPWTSEVFVAITVNDSTLTSPEGALAFSVETGNYKAETTVHLEGGRFKGGTTVGAQVDPPVVVTDAAATVPPVKRGPKATVAGKSTLTVKARFATSGTRPATAPAFACRFGEQFDVTIPADVMKPKGEHVFAGQVGTSKVVLDFRKGVATFTAKKVALGTFVQGANAVDVAVTLGADAADLHLTLRLRKTKLAW